MASLTASKKSNKAFDLFPSFPKAIPNIMAKVTSPRTLVVFSYLSSKFHVSVFFTSNYIENYKRYIFLKKNDLNIHHGYVDVHN